jgi:hypothetical protein
MLGGVLVVVPVVPAVVPVVVPVVPVVVPVVVVPVMVPVVPVVVPVVLVPVVVPVVPVVVPVVVVLVVACPHAGNANTKRKVRAANIIRKYGTYLYPLVHIHTACFTLLHRHKSCNF